MDNAKAAIAGCDLPTGVIINDVLLKAIKYRELAGPEEDILASNMSASIKMTEIMTNCTLDFNGLQNRVDIKKAIEKLIITDRWFYLVQLRIISLGASYYFENTCPQCGAQNKVTYDLRTVNVKNPPDAKNLFHEITLPRSGRKIRWKVSDAETDLKIEKMSKGDRAASVALFARVTEADGRPAALADIMDLPMFDRSTLRKAMEEVEGEFDDKCETNCSKCSHTYEGQLQLDGRTFFSL